MALQNNPNATPMPSRETLALALLTEELKSRRFFGTLLELGLAASYFQPTLDDLIMQCLGLTPTNENLDAYFAVMNEHALKIGIKEETVVEQAKVVYEKLTSFRASLP